MGNALSCAVPSRDAKWEFGTTAAPLPDPVALPVKVVRRRPPTERRAGSDPFDTLPFELVLHILCERVPTAYGPLLCQVCRRWRITVMGWRDTARRMASCMPTDYVWEHGAVSAAAQALLDGHLELAQQIAADRRSVLMPSQKDVLSEGGDIPGTAAWARVQRSNVQRKMWTHCIFRAVLLAPFSPEQTRAALTWIYPPDAAPRRYGWGTMLEDSHLRLAMDAANDAAYVWLSGQVSTTHLPRHHRRELFCQLLCGGMVAAVRLQRPNMQAKINLQECFEAALSSGSSEIVRYAMAAVRSTGADEQRSRSHDSLNFVIVEAGLTAALAVFEGRWDEASATIRGNMIVRPHLSWCYVPMLCPRRRRCRLSGRWIETAPSAAERLYRMLGASVAPSMLRHLVCHGERGALAWLSERGLLVGASLSRLAMWNNHHVLARWLVDVVGVLPDTDYDVEKDVWMFRDESMACAREWRMAGAEWRHELDRSKAWHADRAASKSNAAHGFNKLCGSKDDSTGLRKLVVVRRGRGRHGQRGVRIARMPYDMEEEEEEDA